MGVCRYGIEFIFILCFFIIRVCGELLNMSLFNELLIIFKYLL